MSIVYCDWLNGDDTTGSGTAALPYKSITQASTGLTGGDEVRVAKSTAITSLAGTLAWVDGSTSITTSNDLTGVLSAGDFVGKDTSGETWWEAITVTSTTLTLYKAYSGTTETVASKELGITSTGASAASQTKIQEVLSSGSSTSSRLKISGGWDLNTTTQDGQTYFRQMHGTFTTRYGLGLYSTTKSYLEIEKLSFLRYRKGIYLYSCSNNTITSPTCNSNNDEGIYLYINCNNNTITSPTCNSNNDDGIHLYSNCSNNTITSPTCNSNNDDGIYLHNNCSNNTITSPTCNSNNNGFYLYNYNNNTITSPTCNSNNNGFYLYNCNNNTITSPTCNSNNNGFYLYSCNNNTITSPTCNSNNNDGIYLYLSSNNIANNYSGTGNSNGDIFISSNNYAEYPYIRCQHFKTVGDNRCYYENGVTYRDTAEARSGECLKFDPSSAIYYIRQNFNFRAPNGVAKTITAYIKDDASFNGDIQAAIYFMGVKIIGWTEWTPTTSYVQKSIVAAAGDITEDGVLELAIKVRGTAGNVYVDDLGAS